MKQIKLEVGKTYINRKGEEVKIVWGDSTTKYPCRGDDWEWYAEDGRFDLDVEESECDLIEEVPSETRHTFQIPDGVKELTVEQVGNRIVVEMVPKEGPNPGDVMVNEHGSVYILKAVASKHTHRHHAWLGRDGRVVFDESAISGRPATPEEAQPLFDALKKAGKRWNAETMQVEEIPESDRILEWVEKHLKDGYYNHEDVAEVIEAYLNYKEGKK